MSNYNDNKNACGSTQDSYEGSAGLTGRTANIDGQGSGGRNVDSSSYGNSGTTGLGGRGNESSSFGRDQSDRRGDDSFGSSGNDYSSGSTGLSGNQGGYSSGNQGLSSGNQGLSSGGQGGYGNSGTSSIDDVSAGRTGGYGGNQSGLGRQDDSFGSSERTSGTTFGSSGRTGDSSTGLTSGVGSTGRDDYGTSGRSEFGSTGARTSGVTGSGVGSDDYSSGRQGGTTGDANYGYHAGEKEPRHAGAGSASFGDKLKGTVEQIQGKLKKDPELAEQGAQRKAGNFDESSAAYGSSDRHGISGGSKLGDGDETYGAGRSTGDRSNY